MSPLGLSGVPFTEGVTRQSTSIGCDSSATTQNGSFGTTRLIGLPDSSSNRKLAAVDASLSRLKIVVKQGSDVETSGGRASRCNSNHSSTPGRGS